MSEITCHNCGKKNDGAVKRCSVCHLLMAHVQFERGDRVEWTGAKGSNRMMSGSIVAVIPEYVSADSVLMGTGIRISMKTIADRERPYRSYVVDIGELAQRPAARYVIPSPFILRKTGEPNGGHNT